MPVLVSITLPVDTTAPFKAHEAEVVVDVERGRKRPAGGTRFGGGGPGVGLAKLMVMVPVDAAVGDNVM